MYLYGQSTIDILPLVLLNLPTLLQYQLWSIIGQSNTTIFTQHTHKLTKKTITRLFFFFLEELVWSVPFPNSWLWLQLWVSPNSQFLGIFASPKGEHQVEAFAYVSCLKPLLPLPRRWLLLLPPTSSPQSLNALPSDLTRSVKCLERRFLCSFALPLEFSFLGKP